jgi:hypothetical protein
MELELANIWSEVLARPVTPTCNVFEQGANSVHLLLVLNRMTQLGFDAEASLFFDHPVISDFARALAGQENAGDLEGFLL